MPKVLVIRKPDRTIHQVPLENEAVLRSLNNRYPAGQKWSFEKMDEKEAAKLPFIDPAYVTAAEAVTKVKELESTADAQAQEIAALKEKLAALSSTTANITTSMTAPDLIAKVNAATTPEEVKALIGSDDRKTVLDAAAKKIGSF